MAPVIIFALAGSIAAVAYLLLSQAGDRGAVRSSLRRIEHYELDSVPDIEAQASEPLRDRVLLPMLRATVRLGRRLTPIDYVAKIRNKLTLAGSPGVEQVDRFIAARLLMLLLAPGGFILTFWVLHLSGTKAWGMVGLLCVVAVAGPSARLNRTIAERQKQIQRSLPEVLDLLTISVEAGLGFEQALDKAVDAVPGPLTEELGRMMGEMRAGARRSDALRAFDERVGVPDVHSFSLAILQADTFGVPITRILRSQADEMRIRRRQHAQEAAMKAPVKMLFPMVFCIFPALFAVILGPAALNMMHGLGG
jgi:tight adherence protein C